MSVLGHIPNCITLISFQFLTIVVLYGVILKWNIIKNVQNWAILLYICKLLLATVNILDLCKLSPIIHIEYIYFYFIAIYFFTTASVELFRVLLLRHCVFFLDHLVTESELPHVALCLSPLCTRGQCLAGSDPPDAIYLKMPEPWDRGGDHVTLATAVRVHCSKSLGEADQMITYTCIF